MDDAHHDANDAALVPWVAVAPDDPFGIHTLPLGIVAPHDASDVPRAAIAIGAHVVDLDALQRVGLLDDLDLPSGVFARDALNDFLGLGPRAWRALRRRVSWLLTRADGDLRERTADCLSSGATVHARLPIDVADYTDFYSSRHHAENLGRILRPGTPPLLPNWPHLPVGYHGRAGTVVVSGTPVQRPRGLVPDPARDGRPRLTPSQRLDVEVELGFVVGVPSTRGVRVTPSRATDHVFGSLLVNDWSARDIQAFEYQPLGPFLAKSFATSVSPWIVPLDALAPAFVAPPPAMVELDPYLHDDEPHALPVEMTLALAVDGNAARDLATVNARDLAFTFAQQLAHLTVNGAPLRTGDLFASGTISGPRAGDCGSLIELTRNGARPIVVDGHGRRFLEDGDAVVIRGVCTRPDGVRIGFGTVEGTITPAEED